MASLAVEQANVIEQMIADFHIVGKEWAHKFICELVPKWYVEIIQTAEGNISTPLLEVETFFNGDIDGPENLIYEIFVEGLLLDLPVGFPSSLSEWSEEQKEELDQCYMDDYMEMVNEMMHDIKMVLDYWNLFYLEVTSIDVKGNHFWVKTPVNAPVVEVW